MKTAKEKFNYILKNCSPYNPFKSKYLHWLGNGKFMWEAMFGDEINNTNKAISAFKKYFELKEHNIRLQVIKKVNYWGDGCTDITFKILN